MWNQANEMKMVRTSAGTTYFYPRQMYCYRSVTEFLREKLLVPGFTEMCEAWRYKICRADKLDDVYDGQVWKEFLNPQGVPFLSQPYNYAFSINVDWFQPYKGSVYSAGAIYIALLNLPRTERYKTENFSWLE